MCTKIWKNIIYIIAKIKPCDKKSFKEKSRLLIFYPSTDYIVTKVTTDKSVFLDTSYCIFKWQLHRN